MAPGGPRTASDPPSVEPMTTGVRLERLFDGIPKDQKNQEITEYPMQFNSLSHKTDSDTVNRHRRSVSRRFRFGRQSLFPKQSHRESRRGYRVRRVRRLVRHIEPWSVLKIGLVFYLCVWGMTVIASQALWRTAETAGVIEKVERFVEELFALESFAFDTDKIFRLYILAGLVLVIGGTAVTVVLVVLFNLISDLMGGIRFTMIEEETAIRRRRIRTGDDIAEPEKIGTTSEPDSGGR